MQWYRHFALSLLLFPQISLPLLSTLQSASLQAWNYRFFSDLTEACCHGGHGIGDQRDGEGQQHWAIKKQEEEVESERVEWREAVLWVNGILPPSLSKPGKKWGNHNWSMIAWWRSEKAKSRRYHIRLFPSSSGFPCVHWFPSLHCKRHKSYILVSCGHLNEELMGIIMMDWQVKKYGKI